MISTTCKNCIFREMHGVVQTGCEIGVLSLFEDAGAEITTYVEDGSFKKINRVCMYRRSEWDWENGDLYDEVFIRSNFIIMHTNESIDSLQKTIDSILALHRPKSKSPRIIIIHTSKNVSDILEACKKIPDNNFMAIYLVESVYNNFIYDEAFKRSKNGWTIFTRSGNTFIPETLEIINYAVNTKMRNFVAIPDIECYMAVIYKYLKGQNGESIKNKLEFFPDSTVEWRDLCEDYWNLCNAED